MRSWLPAVTAGVGVAFVALVVILAVRPGADPTPVERADRLAAELRCPDCQGLSVADSPTAAAREIRRQIDELVDGGASDADVRSHFVDRYGSWILLAPTAGIAWLFQWAVGLAAVAVLVAVVVRRRPAPVPVHAPSDGDRRRVRDEVEALDA